jgi:Holliday junction resolvase
MRYANRIDANQNQIVDAMRKVGAVVRIISQGDGIPDLLVGYKGYTILMEVKDGDKVPSARKLTEAEQHEQEWKQFYHQQLLRAEKAEQRERRLIDFIKKLVKQQDIHYEAYDEANELLIDCVGEDKQ